MPGCGYPIMDPIFLLALTLLSVITLLSKIALVTRVTAHLGIAACAALGIALSIVFSQIPACISLSPHFVFASIAFCLLAAFQLFHDNHYKAFCVLSSVFLGIGTVCLAHNCSQHLAVVSFAAAAIPPYLAYRLP